MVPGQTRVWLQKRNSLLIQIGQMKFFPSFAYCRCTSPPHLERSADRNREDAIEIIQTNHLNGSKFFDQELCLHMAGNHFGNILSVYIFLPLN